MKHKLEKNLRIAGELIGYLYKKRCRDIDMSFKFKKPCTYIEVKGLIDNMNQEDIDYLKEVLNRPRQHEVEECYWLANGEGNLGEELLLVGVMIDSVEINYNNSVLDIKLVRDEEA